MKKKLPTILLKAKEEVFSHLQGATLSKLFGQGYDFSELREYEGSDDIRHISWINSAKLGEPYVKKMHEERELNIVLCTLLDGRMVIGQKQELMSYILALLSYSSILSRNHLVTLFLSASGLEYSFIGQEFEAVESTVEKIYNYKALAQKLDYNNIEEALLQYVAEKSLFIILGDFLDEVTFSILAQKHELILIVIRDEEEENPTLYFDEQLLNPLNNQAVSQRLSRRAIAYYQKKLKAHDHKLWNYCHQHQIKIAKIYKEETALARLSELFNT